MIRASRRADADRPGPRSRRPGRCTTSRTRSSASPSCPGRSACGWSTIRQFGERDGNFLLSLAIVVSVGLNAIVSPILGALSDRGGRRLPFLLAFTRSASGPTAFIADVGATGGLVLFIVANFAYQAALIYYDATLKTVSHPETRGTLSGIGVAVGYLGTIFVGLAHLPARHPGRGPVPARGGALFAFFAIPIFVVRQGGAGERGRRPTRPTSSARSADLPDTIEHARAVPGLGRFLLGRFFYSDAVNTVIVVMSVVASKAKGLSPTYTNLLLLSLTVVAVIAESSAGAGSSIAGARSGRSWWSCGRGPSGWSSAGSRSGSAVLVRARPVPDRRRDPRQRPRRRPGRRPRVHGPALAAGPARRVLRAVRARRQGLAGHRAAAVRADPRRGPSTPSGNGAYQVAVLSLLVTMLIGRWLIRPVSGRVVRFRRAERCRSTAAPPRRRRGRASGPADAADSSRASRQATPRDGGPEIQAAFDMDDSGRRRDRVGPSATPRPSRSSPRASSAAGRQPRTLAARSMAATRTGGSPARRGPIVWGPAARRPLGRREDLADAEAAAAAEVADQRAVGPRVAGRRRLERPQVRVGEVDDVDVVADAGPVGRRVVVAEERQPAPAPHRARGRSGSGGSRGRGPRRCARWPPRR